MHAKLVAPSLRHLLQYSPESLADDQLALQIVIESISVVGLVIV